jgi:hypothetical protein
MMPMMGVGGGLSGGLSYLSANITGAISGTVGLGAAIGAIAAPLLAVAAVFSFFKKKTKELDAGMRITVKGLDTLTETFKVIQTTRFWGLSKKVRTEYQAAIASVSDPIENAIFEMQNGIVDMAGTLGIAGSAFDNFSRTIQFSLKGLSEADALAEIQKQIAEFGDAFAGRIPGLRRLEKAGEGLAATLARVSAALTVSNAWLDRFHTSLFATSVAGAGLAAAFTDMFGGLEAMNTATAFFYENFYSTSERIKQATIELGTALSGLGIDIIPRTRDAFRDLIDASFGAGNTDLAAQLILLAPAMAGITDQANDMTDALDRLDRQSLFSTRAEQVYAAGAAGYGSAAIESNALLMEVVRAIREGDINNARLTSRLLAVQERTSLGAAA